MARVRVKHGISTRTYTDPEDLWDDAKAYFMWCEKNPHKELRLSPRRNGRPYREYVDHPRAFTAAGLAAFCGFKSSSIKVWLENEDHLLHDVACKIADIMHEQKFTYAAVGLMNAQLVSRDLGLADKREVEGGGNVIVNLTGDERDL